MDINEIANILAEAADSASDEIALAYAEGDVLVLQVRDTDTGEFQPIRVKLAIEPWS